MKGALAGLVLGSSSVTANNSMFQPDEPPTARSLKPFPWMQQRASRWWCQSSSS